ncbi:hypothetical protein JZ751_008027 [Albula glossodonta]|uniref:Potassium voltage-gated channel subfamily G member 3 n=1 Tax=Albula glossodonta TaxID=121402 RepID=A0A8T2P1B7_9TELE|nr:hypothetical protein JZ751_008027 [Albula glossodonta]
MHQVKPLNAAISGGVLLRDITGGNCPLYLSWTKSDQSHNPDVQHAQERGTVRLESAAVWQMVRYISPTALMITARLHNCASEKEVLEVCDDYDRERNEFFFDRHSEAFVFIMLYVKSGKLRFVPQMCELSFYNEMIYWGLESSHLEFCCQRRLDDRMSDTYTYFSEEDIKTEEESRDEEDLDNPRGSAKWLERMRRTFEEPTSSVAAQILASVSVIFVIMSMVILCASTLPDWESAKNNNVEEHRYTGSWEIASGCQSCKGHQHWDPQAFFGQTAAPHAYLPGLVSRSQTSQPPALPSFHCTHLVQPQTPPPQSPMPNCSRAASKMRLVGIVRLLLVKSGFSPSPSLHPPHLSHLPPHPCHLSDHVSSRIIEAVCIGWFTAECIVRFIVSRDKCEFVRRPLNIIDLLAITPYYVSVVMTVLTGENPQLQRAGVTLRVLRMMRIFWLIKLARHFLGLQTLGLTLKRCYREMVMLLVFVCVAMAIFSALAQLLEHGLDLHARNEDYASIPAACWWVIISMTTVGYGDMYPITMPGRVLGGVCVVSGIVLLALPITFIYHSFVQCYHELRFRSNRCARSLSAEASCSSDLPLTLFSILHSACSIHPLLYLPL